MYKAQEHIVHRKKGDLLVVLDTRNGHYYTFNTTAVDIWMDLVEGGKSIETVLTALQDKYDETPDEQQLRSEVDNLLQVWTARGLIEEV